jgi:hypothetical protein
MAFFSVARPTETQGQIGTLDSDDDNVADHLHELPYSQNNGNGDSQFWSTYMNEYPIDQHAGPMFIHEKQNTFCGICGMCITLEDEQAVSRAVNPYTTTGPGTAQHADAGNVEFEELQQGDAHYNVECSEANERIFGVMPRPGWTGFYRVGEC